MAPPPLCSSLLRPRDACRMIFMVKIRATGQVRTRIPHVRVSDYSPPPSPRWWSPSVTRSGCSTVQQLSRDRCPRPGQTKTASEQRKRDRQRQEKSKNSRVVLSSGFDDTQQVATIFTHVLMSLTRPNGENKQLKTFKNREVRSRAQRVKDGRGLQHRPYKRPLIASTDG